MHPNRPPRRHVWTRFRDLPPTRLPVMNHSDLIPGNVLVADGRLAGVLDLGGLKGSAVRRGRSSRRSGLVRNYVDSNPTMSRMGRRTLERILADG